MSNGEHGFHRQMGSMDFTGRWRIPRAMASIAPTLMGGREGDVREGHGEEGRWQASPLPSWEGNL